MSIQSTQLRRYPIFAGLAEVDLQNIAPSIVIRRFAAHQVILHQNELPAYVVIVINGQLQSSVLNEEGRIVALTIINPDETIGWESIIDNMPLAQSLSTTKDTDLLLIPANIAKMLLTSPWSAAEVLRILTKTIRRVTDEHRVLSIPNAYQRVYTQLLNLTTSKTNATQPPPNLPKQQELAVMVNTSRETVSRALQALIKQGILVKSGHQFLIKDLEKLKQVAAESTDKLSA